MSAYRRMTLRRMDGRVYLDRWGIGFKRFGAVFVHRMEAPDPGIDLHDHPWTFVSVVLKGEYTEERALCREAPEHAQISEMSARRRVDLALPPILSPRGLVEHRARWSIRRLRLDECHRITDLHDHAHVWTLVICGPVRRGWGFYMPDGYIDEHTYDETVRVHRRDMVVG